MNMKIMHCIGYDYWAYTVKIWCNSHGWFLRFRTETFYTKSCWGNYPFIHNVKKTALIVSAIDVDHISEVLVSISQVLSKIAFQKWWLWGDLWPWKVGQGHQYYAKHVFSHRTTYPQIFINEIKNFLSEIIIIIRPKTIAFTMYMVNAN